MSLMAHATAMFAIMVSVLVWTLGQVQGHSATTFAFANTSHPTCPLNTVDSSNRKGGKNTFDAVVTVDVINSFDEIKDPECVDICAFNDDQVSGHLSPGRICIKPVSEDEYISVIIRQSGCWEAGIVNSVLHAMILFPSATFLDLGANIGMYTVTVANLGRKVVAVDASLQNLAYIDQSLHLNSNRENVTLINNAVSDVYMTYYPLIPPGQAALNPGSAVMLTLEQLREKNAKASFPPVKSIRLEDVLEVIDADIVIMKIDIEGYECKALLPEILMNKRGKFIPFIFIEWGTLYTRQEAVCPEYNDWVQLFVKGGYQPANAGNIWEKTDVKTVERDHWQDLVWIHASVQL